MGSWDLWATPFCPPHCVQFKISPKCQLRRPGSAQAPESTLRPRSCGDTGDPLPLRTLFRHLQDGEQEPLPRRLVLRIKSVMQGGPSARARGLTHSQRVVSAVSLWSEDVELEGP